MTGRWLWLIHKCTISSLCCAESAGENRFVAELEEGGRRGERTQLELLPGGAAGSVCSLLLVEDVGLTQETEVVEYQRVTEKGNYVY